MNRYVKQIQLEGIGPEGQEKLSNSRVLVVGAGGLGCAVIPYLAGAGVGTIGITDGDQVETSNLHRQILYKENARGTSKVQKAAEFVRGYNSEIEVLPYPRFLDEKNAKSIFPSFDIIVDATDSIPARILINEMAELLDKPVVYASVYKHEAQLSVFNYENGPTYSDAFGPLIVHAPNCTDTGVLGTTVGIIGIMQANEVLKMILGIGRVLSGKLLVYNSLTNEQNVFSMMKKEKPNEQQLHSTNIKSLSYHGTVREALSSENAQIIDIRERYEEPYLTSDIVQKVPLSDLELYMDSIPKEQSIYFLCQKGARSLSAARRYGSLGYNVKSISGGVFQFKKQIEYEQ